MPGTTEKIASWIISGEKINILFFWMDKGQEPLGQREMRLRRMDYRTDWDRLREGELIEAIGRRHWRHVERDACMGVS